MVKDFFKNKNRLIPIFLILGLVLITYWQFFILGKIPIPADTLIGAYFPWYDNSFGYATKVPVKNPIISDVFSQIVVWKYLSMEIFKSGQFPLWNPYSFSGAPLLANYQSSPFFPFNIVLFLPQYYGWGLFIALQLVSSLFGMYFLLGFYTKRFLSQIIGAVVFSFSGLMSLWTEYGTAVWAVSMLPWIFYCLESYLIKKRLRYLFLFSFAFASLCLAGQSQIITYAVILTSLFLFYKLLIKKVSKGELLNVLIAWGLSFGISSIQLLPSFDIVKDSLRSSEGAPSGIGNGLNPIYQLVRLFIPDFFGNPVTQNYWDKLPYHEHSSFLGTLTLPFLIPFLFKRFRNHTVNFFGIIFLVSLLLAYESPLTRWLYSLNSSFLTYSNASRIFFVLSFASGVLLGMSVEKFSEDDHFRFFVKRSTTLMISITLGIFIGFLIALYMTYPFIDSGELSYIIKTFITTLRNMAIPLSLLTALFLLTFKFFKKTFFIYILVFFFFFDMSRYFWKYNPFVDPSLIFPKNPVLDYLQAQKGLFRIGRVDPEILPPNTWTHYHLQSVEGYDPLALEDYGHYFHMVNNELYTDGISRYMQLTNYSSKFLDALNLKYLLAIQRNPDGTLGGGKQLNYKVDPKKYKRVFEDKNTVVLENTQAVDRAYFMKKVTSVANKNQMIQKLENPHFDPTQEAIIMSDKSFPKIEAEGSIQFLEYSPNKITLKTNASGKSFLTLAESYNDGWKVTRDGILDTLYQVNGALRGVEVPKGEHTFIFSYYPTSFDLGLKLSSLSLLLLLIAYIYAWRTKRL